MGFFDKVKKAFGSKKEDGSQNSVNDEVIDEPTFTQSIEKDNGNFNDYKEDQSEDSEETHVNEEVIDEPTPDEKIRNFRYLDELVHSGVKEIVLDSDIVLGDDEESQYLNGIKLDVDDLVIDGNGHSIDAQGKTRIFEANGKNIIIKNIIFKNGFNIDAGAIYNKKFSSLEIDNCNFNENTAQEDGGAILNWGKISLAGTSFTKNTTKEKSGGAVNNERDGEISINDCNFNENTAQSSGGAIMNFGKISLDGTSFTKNTTKEKFGGAVNNQRDGEISINDCNFNENTAQEDGGAIFNFGKITLDGTSFTKNTTKTNNGGAVNNQSSGEISINDCNFNENTAQGSGGAIFNFGKISLAGTSFTKNTTKTNNGGAVINKMGAILICNDCGFINNIGATNLSIYNESDNAKFIKCKFLQHKGGNVVFNKNDLIFMDCIFRDNDVDSIILNDSDSILDLSGGKITDNTVRDSAVYNNKGNMSISNTLFKNNTSTSDIYQRDVLNEGDLILQSPKFKTDTYSVLNKNHIDVKKLSHGEVEKIIKNTSTGSIDEFFIPNEYKFDFSHLDKLIQEDNSGVISLNEDIVLENYESDFFEGGIEINEDDIIIDGNNHMIDARNKTRIFQVLGKNITIKNLIFKNGYVSNRYGEHITGGGAIQTLKNSSLTLENCQFVDNYSDNDGGAIQNNGILYSNNNKYISNKTQYNGGAIHNNNILCSTNDTFKENRAKIAGTIYNNKKLTIKEEINLQNNKSDFKQPIYNTNTVNIKNQNINPEEIIYNTCNVNKTENDNWESWKCISDKLENTDEISLEKNIKIEYNDILDDEFIISDLVLDGNNHIIDLNHLNLNFIIKNKAIFKNIIFKNAYIHKKSLFEITSDIKFENVKFINNKITTDHNLIKNNKGNVEIIDSSFYNNSSKNNSLINNDGKLTVINAEFINNNSQAEGTIINNKIGNKEKVLIEKSIFINNFSTKKGGTIISQGSVFEIRDTQFINNQSKLYSGAITNSGDEFKLFCCIFRGNTANNGGAIYNFPNSFLDINDCNFNENTAQGSGGAILNFGKISLAGTDFTKNTTKEKSGGAVNNQRSGEISINDCNFNKNTAQEVGGAIYTIKDEAVKLNNCTFKDNKPDDVYEDK